MRAQFGGYYTSNRTQKVWLFESERKEVGKRKEKKKKEGEKQQHQQQRQQKNPPTDG